MQIICISGLWALIVIFSVEATESTLSFFPVSSESDRIEQVNLCALTSENTTDFNYRLPNETYPEHYMINVTTSFHTGERTFRGQVVIDVVIANSTSDIVLHLRQLNITKASIKNSFTGSTHMLVCKYELRREFLTLRRADKGQFAAGTKWKLTISYRGELRKDEKGFYLSKYSDNEGKERYLATTQFESTNARSAFPCYDEPNKRANFTIIINHSPNYTAISNMPVNQVLSRPGKTVFLTSPPMSTYLVGFVLSEFEYIEEFSNGLRQRVYYRPFAKSRYEWVLTSAITIEKYLSDYCGVKFMLPKLDHVVIPDLLAVGMENWGLITYRESKFLYDDNNDLWTFQLIPLYVLIHEMAHQWFGDYVTIEWWTSTWIKEGFAYFISYKALCHYYPELGAEQLLHVSEYQLTLHSDGDYSSRSKAPYIQTPKEIDESYSLSFLYKHSYILLMWNNALTEKNFQIGLRKFLTENKYTAVSEEKLFEALQRAVEEQNFRIPASVSDMMGSWIHQDAFPILTVTRNYDDGTFVVRQEAFYNDGVSRDNLTWYVPINYAVASNPDFLDTRATHYLLNDYEMKFDDVGIAEKDWLILNKQSFGLYRINYDARNWDLITEGLLKDPFKIHVRNRAQLMDDANSFTTSNRLDDAILLKLMAYLKYEDQYAPWSTASHIISKYNSHLRGDEKYDDYKFFVTELVRPIYKKLGINDIPGEHYLNKYVREIAISISCEIGLQECLRDTNNKLRHLVNKTTFTGGIYESMIYCYGLIQSDDNLFNLVYQKLMESTDSNIREELILGMGCTQTENQIKKFIHSSIDMSNVLRPEERYTILPSIYSHGTIGLLTCIEFLNENWNFYNNLTNGKYNIVEKYIRRMAVYVVNKKEEEKFSALVAKLESSRQIDVSVATEAYKTVADNLQWLRKHGEPIRRWLAKYRTESANGVTK